MPAHRALTGRPQHRHGRVRSLRSGPWLRVPLALLVATATVLVGAVAPSGSRPAGAIAGGFPAVISKTVIGHSVQGRPINAYRMGNPYSSVKVIILGQMHGDEPAGTVVARAIVHQSSVITGADVWVISTMNPDGAARGTRQNAHGVDLNRNWPDYWKPLTGEFYSGPKALSEPETRAMYNFLVAIKPKYLISLHQPLDGVDTTDGGAKFPAFSASLASKLHLPQKAFTCGGFCYGSMTGWVTNHQSGVAITVEFGSSPSQTYLTQTARVGILAAVHTHLVVLKNADPVVHIDVAGATGRSVKFTGWTYDPDLHATALTTSFYDGSRRLVTRATNVARADVNKRYGLTGKHGFSFATTASVGTHRYCLRVTNVGAGHPTTTVCRTITVAG